MTHNAQAIPPKASLTTAFALVGLLLVLPGCTQEGPTPRIDQGSLPSPRDTWKDPNYRELNRQIAQNAGLDARAVNLMNRADRAYRQDIHDMRPDESFDDRVKRTIDESNRMLHQTKELLERSR
jgi:hypothetical protein